MPPLKAMPEVSYSLTADEEYRMNLEKFRLGDLALCRAVSYDSGKVIAIFLPHAADASEALVQTMHQARLYETFISEWFADQAMYDGIHKDLPFPDVAIQEKGCTDRGKD